MEPLTSLNLNIIPPEKPKKRGKLKYKEGFLVENKYDDPYIEVEYTVRIKNAISMSKLLNVCPWFVEIVSKFRKTHKLEGNEFTLEDLKILNEDLFSEWNIETHPYKVNLSFIDKLSLNRAREIYKSAIHMCEELETASNFKTIEKYLKRFDTHLVNILLTNSIDLSRYSVYAGIAIIPGEFLINVDRNAKYIELDSEVTIPTLVSYIKNYSFAISSGQEIDALNIDDKTVDLLRYGFVDSYGKYNKLMVKSSHYPHQKYSAIKLKDMFKRKKQYLKEKGLISLFRETSTAS